MAEIAPEFAALLAQPGQHRTAEIRVGPPSNRRTPAGPALARA
jgi:hypothetical protein